MSRNPVHFACASAGALILFAAAFAVRSSGFQAGLLAPILIGMLLLLPAAFENHEIESSIERFRSAALICFMLAFGCLGITMAFHDRMSRLPQQIASLGGAFWIVGILMAGVFAIHSSRRRSLARHE